MLRSFYKSVGLLVLLNLLLKPLWVLCIDRKVQLLVGNETYGSYFALLNTALIVGVLLDGGLQIYYTTHRQDVKLTQLIYLKLVLSVVYIAFALLCSTIFTSGISLLFITIIGHQLCTAFILLLRSHFSATQRYKLDSVFSIMDKLLAIIILGIILYILPQHFTLQLFVSMQLVMALLLLLLLFVLLYKKGVVHLSSLKLNREILKSIAPYTLLVLLMAILLRADVLLLKYLHPYGNEEAGKYAYGFRLFDALNSFGFLMASFLFPFLHTHQLQKEILSKTTKQLRNFLLSLTAVGLIIFYCFRNFFTTILYHTNNSEIIRIIFLCLIAFIGSSLVHIYGSLLTATKRIKAFCFISTVFVILTISFNCFFIKNYGSLACASILCVIQLLYGSTLWWYSKRIILK